MTLLSEIRPVGGSKDALAPVSIFANLGRSDKHIKSGHRLLDPSEDILTRGGIYALKTLGALTVSGVTKNYMALEKASLTLAGSAPGGGVVVGLDNSYNSYTLLAPATTWSTEYAALGVSIAGSVVSFGIAPSTSGRPSHESTIDLATTFPAWVTGDVQLSALSSGAGNGKDGIALNDTTFCKMFTATFQDVTGPTTVGWTRILVKFFYNGAAWVVTAAMVYEAHELYGPGVTMNSPYVGGALYTLGGGSGQHVAYSFAERSPSSVNNNVARLLVIDTLAMTTPQSLLVADATFGTDYPINMNSTGGLTYLQNEYIALCSASWRSIANDDRPWFAIYQWNGTALVSILAATRPTGGDYVDCNYKMSLTDATIDPINPQFKAVTAVRVPGVTTPAGNGVYLPCVYDLNCATPGVTGRLGFGLTTLPTTYGAWAVETEEFQYYLHSHVDCINVNGSGNFVKRFGPSLVECVKVPFSSDGVATPNWIDAARLTNIETESRSADRMLQYTPFANFLMPPAVGLPGEVVSVTFFAGDGIVVPDQVNTKGFPLPVTSTTWSAKYGFDGSGVFTLLALSGPKSQVAHGFVVGDVVRFNGTSWVKSIADTAANSEVFGIVKLVAGPNAFDIYEVGDTVSGLTGLTLGATYFLSQTVAGTLTATEPVSGVSKPVLLALSATSGIFFNMRGVTL